MGEYAWLMTYSIVNFLHHNIFPPKATLEIEESLSHSSFYLNEHII